MLLMAAVLTAAVAPSAFAANRHVRVRHHAIRPDARLRAARHFAVRRVGRPHVLRRAAPTVVAASPAGAAALEPGGRLLARPFSQVSGVQASVSPSNGGAEAVVYKVRFKATSALAEEVDLIHVALPAGASLEGCGEGTEVIDGIHASNAAFSECGQEMAVLAPYSIAKGDTVELLIRGATNPPAKASVKVEVWTSTDTTRAASPSFEITAPTALGAVQGSVVPSNAKAEQVVYKIKFKATSSLTAEVARITVLLPSGASIEGCGEGTEVIDGAKAERAFFSRCSGQELAVWTPYGISAGDNVELAIRGATNPSAKTSSAKIEAWTSTDIVKASSPAFSITEATAVTALSASVSPTAAGAETAVYKVKFKATTGLAEEVGRIHITLPTGATLEGCGEGTEVIDGTKSSRASFNACDQEVVVWTPFSIAAGDSVEVVIRGAVNPPAKTSSAKVEVRTSSDANSASSPSFSITEAAAVTAVTASVSPTNGGAETAVYRVKLKVTSGLAEDVGKIHVVLPAGASTFEGCGEGTELIDGAKAASASFNTCGPETTLWVPFDVAAGDSVELVIRGVVNPPGQTTTAKVEVSTSTDVTKVSSPNFAITEATAVTGVSASVSPTNAGAEHAVYRVKFKATSALIEEFSRIHILLPSEAGSYFCGEGTEVIDGAKSAGAGLLRCGEETVVYAPFDIAAGDNVEVVIHGVVNPPSKTASAKVEVSTSIDASRVSSATFEITAGVVPVNLSPPVQYGLPYVGETLYEYSGNWDNGPTGYSYQWLRCEHEHVGCAPISEATTREYTLTSADLGHVIEASDTASNSAGSSPPATSTASEAVTALVLHAGAGENLTGTVGSPVEFDGTSSSPVDAIDSYHWTFGDGASANGAYVDHTYESPGTYSATLTVTANGREASTAITVTVTTPAPGAQITVHDESNAPISEATVLYVGANGQRASTGTSGAGLGTLHGLPDGSDTVYVYKEGFQPAIGHVTVSGGAGSTTVALSSGAVATSTLEDHQMNVKEIEEAGIDVNDPANQNVYKFEIRLAFINEYEVACDINGAGEFVGACAISGGGGGGGGCSADGCSFGGGGGGGGAEVEAIPAVVEGHPLIQWLVLEGSVTTLKQFEALKMTIQNLSPEPFTMTNGKATLQLPEGLSLAPTATPQSPSQTVPTIAGMGSQTTTWIVRGDIPGSYDLSAVYDGRLEPFEAPVHVLAKLAEPLRVWGVEALKLSVKADSGSLFPGRPYHVTVGVTNNSPIPIYNMDLALDPTVHANFDYQPAERFHDFTGELKPGATLFSHRYILLPDAESESVFKPNLSTATFAGQEAHPGEGIEAVTPPPLYGIEALSGTPGRVHLHWQAVPGAEGYEVFSTPDLTAAFGEAPDAAASTAGGTPGTEPLPSGSTDAYVPGTGSTRWYAVTAIVGGVPTLESSAIQSSASLAAPEPPDLGLCEKVAAGAGKYGKASCTATGGKDGYEWFPAFGEGTHLEKTHFTTLAKAPSKITLETHAKAKYTCTAESGSGQYTGAKTVSGVTLVLTGCASGSEPCTSSGAKAGEVVSSSLHGSVGVTKAGSPSSKDKAGISFASTGSTPFAEFTCGSTTVTLKGSIIGELKANAMETSQTIKFGVSKGAEKILGFVGGLEQKLEAKRGAGAFESAGLGLTTIQTNEEAGEVNTVV
jgi:PKD repeat protein